MNIVLMHYTAPPIVGGVETVLARHAHLLTQVGHRVRILSGRGKTWDAQVPVETMPLMDPRHPIILRAKASLDEGLIPDDFSKLVEQMMSDLRRILWESDVVILHNLASLHKNLVLTQALFQLSQVENAPRFILWHHDLAATLTRYQSELHVGLPWDLLCKPWPGSVQVVVSQEQRQKLTELMDLPLEQVHVVSAGLAIADFLGLQPLTVSLINQLHLLEAAPILLSPVRVARRKNLEQAITCLGVLRGTFPQAALIITGLPSNGGDYLRTLQKLRDEMNLQDAVHFLAELAADGLPEASVTDLYRLVDGLLLTSREEGFGMPILEAGLSGIPIFCTRLPSLHTLAGEDACYFSPNDPPGVVAQKIVQNLEHDSRYHMRVHVRQEYIWEAVYQRQIAPLLT